MPLTRVLKVDAGWFVTSTMTSPNNDVTKGRHNLLKDIFKYHLDFHVPPSFSGTEICVEKAKSGSNLGHSGLFARRLPPGNVSPREKTCSWICDKNFLTLSTHVVETRRFRSTVFVPNLFSICRVAHIKPNHFQFFLWPPNRQKKGWTFFRHLK